MSRFVKLAGVTLLGVAVTGAMVFAEDDAGKAEKHRNRGKGDHHGRMKMMDKDGDGKVSYDEFKAGHMKRLEAMFKKIDRNGDGFISKEDHAGKGDKAKGEGKAKKHKGEDAAAGGTALEE